MKRKAPLLLIFTSSLCVLGHASGVKFHDLGTLPGTTNSAAYAVSANGSVVVGESYNDGGESGPDVGRAFRWTESTGMQDVGGLPEGLRWAFSANGVSADGSVIVGSNGHPFLWTQASGMSDLYTLPTPGWGSASDVSADGSVVIGSFSSAGQELTFRWTQAGGMQDLGALPGGNESYATGVSADGSIVVGKAYYANSEQNRPFYWTKAGGMKDLGVPPGAEYLWATGISADGSLVILDSGVPNFYRWTQASGFQAVPAPVGAIGSSPWGVSGDGSVVVGDFKNANGQYRAFRWTKSEGSQDLNKLLPTLGVDLTGWTLEGAEAVSSDGSTIVGQGLYKGAERAFAISGFPAAGKKLQKATFKLPSKMVYDGSYALRATFNCKGPVTYSVDDVTAAQVTGSQLKIRKADAPFNVFARQAGDSTWAAAEVQAAGTAGRRPQRIAFTVKSNATVGQTLPLSVTVNSPLAVDVTSSDSGIVRVNGDRTATALAKGSAVLTAMQNGDTNHAPAKSLQKTVTVR